MGKQSLVLVLFALAIGLGVRAKCDYASFIVSQTALSPGIPAPKCMGSECWLTCNGHGCSF